MESRFFGLQRITAIVMVPLIVGHLATILYAVRDGLTAGEILARTEGSIFWIGFYGLFVLCASIHAPLGVRNILIEWTPLGRRAIDLSMIAFCILLLLLGARAVMAVGGMGL